MTNDQKTAAKFMLANAIHEVMEKEAESLEEAAEHLAEAARFIDDYEAMVNRVKVRNE